MLENIVCHIQQGGISIQGALIAGVLFAYWYVKRHQLPFWKTADAFAPAIILGQAIGRVGCDVFGVPMEGNWFWGVQVNGQLLHPAQLYEAMLNFLLFLLLWQKRKSTAYDGQLFILYMAGFSLNRMIVEFFRTNPQVFGPISIAHVFSLIMIVVTLMVGRWLQKKEQKEETPQISGGNATMAMPVMEWITLNHNDHNDHHRYFSHLPTDTHRYDVYDARSREAGQSPTNWNRPASNTRVIA